MTSNGCWPHFMPLVYVFQRNFGKTGQNINHFDDFKASQLYTNTYLLLCSTKLVTSCPNNSITVSLTMQSYDQNSTSSWNTRFSHSLNARSLSIWVLQGFSPWGGGGLSLCKHTGGRTQDEKSWYLKKKKMADGLTLGWFEMIGYRRHSMVTHSDPIRTPLYPTHREFTPSPPRSTPAPQKDKEKVTWKQLFSWVSLYCIHWFILHAPPHTSLHNPTPPLSLHVPHYLAKRICAYTVSMNGKRW